MNESKILAIIRREIFVKAVPALIKTPFKWHNDHEEWVLEDNTAEIQFPCENGGTYLVLASLYDENDVKIAEEIDLFYKYYGAKIMTLFGAAQLVTPLDETIDIKLRQNATMPEITKKIKEALRTSRAMLRATRGTYPDSCRMIVRKWKVNSLWK